MKKLFLLALLLAFTSIGLGQGSGPITVKEVDGSPVCNNCRTFVFPNGSLTVSGNKVTVASGGGSSGITIGVTTITSGTTTRVLHNNAGVVGEYTVTGSGNVVLSAGPTFTGTITAAAITASGQYINSLNGAASTPPVTLTGTWFTGGSATTTKPQLLIEPTGATSTGWSTAGTGLGVNAASGFTGRLLDLQLNGAAKLYVDSTGILYVGSGTIELLPGLSAYGFSVGGGGYVDGLRFRYGGAEIMALASGKINMQSSALFSWSSTTSSSGTPDIILRRSAAANLAFGAADAASPVAQTLSVQNVVAGTSNTAGVDWTKKASAGTGTGVGGAHVWQVAPAGSSGTSQNSFVEAMRITGAGVIQYPTTITAGGTTGNQTIDKVSGTVNIAAAGTTVTVTSNKVTANSICFAVLRTNDATAALKNVVPGAGSFTINLTAATTAETSIGFFCINP